MEDKKCECKSCDCKTGICKTGNCKTDSCKLCDNLPLLLQGVIVYELAIIIVLLVSLQLDSDETIKNFGKKASKSKDSEQ